MSALVKCLRWHAPIVASAAVVITLVTCLILAKTRDVYTGGLKWPYFSDMGRDSPGYYVFCVGLTIAAIMLACTWYFNYHFQAAILRKPMEVGRLSRSVLRWAITCKTLGMISVVGLPVLAFFSTSSYPSLHNYAAYWFFILETIAVCINTFVSYKIYSSTRGSRISNEVVSMNAEENEKTARFESVRRTFFIQLVMFVLFFIAFLLYIPIGLAVVKPFEHLSVKDCLARNFGEKYCTKDFRLDEIDTKLWNYENDFAASQMRAGAQLACILTLVGYSVSFLSHDYTNVVDTESIENSTAVLASP
ncbi:hypothetical protein Poli38472_010104 [Pythium oligandrum]|uniref:CWH43-like N-terminal domain-containing protein n=1 Tax=Pythium oligandrum TaxID=41045 RepID=A0A8K1FCP8_PYTOL|nr:hypothetical protein Poli38472_010104 [Pythium oligandrum]|eukprot:TMW58545.1 hypothetical protein Poli38472_010104 [Pythium oligandrum]